MKKFAVWTLVWFWGAMAASAFAQCSEKFCFRGVDPRLFDKKNIVYAHTGYKKITSPNKRWTWYNNWQLIRRQPGVFKTAVGKAPYTLTNCFDKEAADEYTWVHYSFFKYAPQEPLREEYDCSLPEIRDEIWKKRRHSAQIIRIDKIADNVYIVMYVRSDQKRFHLKRVDYPPFQLGKNVGIAPGSIIFHARVKSLDPYGREIFIYEKAQMSVRDIVLLNPRFFLRPVELEEVFIPYSFFIKNFIYDHPQIIKAYKSVGDVAVVKIRENGVIFRFPKKPSLPEW